ncbi:MAG: NfeD family protein [Actinomycetota bacterium]|nr:NfeD family protein [Actinomycetota bacterium]
MEIFGLESWLFWFLLGMVMLGAEALIAFTLYAGSVALAALVAAVVAAFDASIEVQILAFSVAAALSLLFVRPIARRHLIVEDKVKVGHEALVGKRAMVLQEVSVDGGRVKIEGDVWSARVDDETAVLEAGSRVEVVAFRGAFAIVAAESDSG